MKNQKGYESSQTKSNQQKANGNTKTNQIQQQQQKKKSTKNIKKNKLIPLIKQKTKAETTPKRKSASTIDNSKTKNKHKLITPTSIIKKIFNLPTSPLTPKNGKRNLQTTAKRNSAPPTTSKRRHTLLPTTTTTLSTKTRKKKRKTPKTPKDDISISTTSSAKSIQRRKKNTKNNKKKGKASPAKRKKKRRTQSDTLSVGSFSSTSSRSSNRNKRRKKSPTKKKKSIVAPAKANVSRKTSDYYFNKAIEQSKKRSKTDVDSLNMYNRTKSTDDISTTSSQKSAKRSATSTQSNQSKNRKQNRKPKIHIQNNNNNMNTPKRSLTMKGTQMGSSSSSSSNHQKKRAITIQTNLITKKRRKKVPESARSKDSNSSNSSKKKKKKRDPLLKSQSEFYLDQRMTINFLKQKLKKKEEELASFTMKYEKLLSEYTDVSQNYMELKEEMKDLQQQYNALVDQYNETTTPKSKATSPFETPKTPPNRKEYYEGKHLSRDDLPQVHTTKEQTPIIKEFIKTEYEYVKNLNLMTKYYIERLEKQSSIISPDDFRILFGEVQVIIGINIKLLDMLERIFPNCFDQQHHIKASFDSISYFFREQYYSFVNELKAVEPTFRLYVGYISNYARCLHRLNELTASKKSFADFLSKSAESLRADAAARMVTLNDFLITPVQRIPRYRLLMEDLLAHTPSDDAIYDDLSQLVENIRTTAKHCNERQGQIQTTLRVLELKSQHARASISQDVWISPSRRYVYDDEKLKRTRQNKRLAAGHVILFNDQLLFIQQVTSLLSTQSRSKVILIPYKNISVSTLVKAHQIRFYLPNGDKHQFVAANQAHYDRFISTLRTILLEHDILVNDIDVASPYSDDLCSSTSTSTNSQ